MIPNADLNRQPGFLEKGFVIMAMLFYAGAFIALLERKAGIEVIPGDPDPFVVYISYPIYMVTAFLIIKYRYYNEVIALLKKEKFLACIIGIVFLSALWSVFPLITLRRSVGLTGTTLLGIYLAVRYSLEEQLKLLAIMLGIVAIGSLLFALFLPSYGITSELHEGAWRGIFVHKNVLGLIMVLSSIVFILLNVRGGKYRLIKWFFLGLSLSLIMLSTSKTSLLLFVILLALLPFYKSLQWHFYIRVFIYCLLIVVVVGSITWLVENTKFVLNAIGRDATLTGRTDLWEAIMIMIKKRPLLGYGYNAFWHGVEGKASAYVWQIAGWNVAHSHNGFLEICLDIGLVGIAIFIAGCAQAIRNAIRMICLTNNMEALWPLVYITFILIYNLNESSLIQHNRATWVIYVSVILSLCLKNSKTIILDNYEDTPVR